MGVDVNLSGPRLFWSAWWTRTPPSRVRQSDPEAARVALCVAARALPPMASALLMLSLCAGGDPTAWSAASARRIRQYLQAVPVWDYNETCVDGRTVPLTGPLPLLGDLEVRAWNTAVFLTLEAGRPPAYVGVGRCAP